MTDVSLIVCSRNRAESLILCLDAMLASVRQAGDVAAEIVVVDNNSTDDTAARVKGWMAAQDIPTQYVLETAPGVSAAKNTAVKAAKGRLLILTDDDCRLDVNHVRDALRYEAVDDAPVMRGGRVELGDPTDLPITIKTDDHAQRWHHSLHSIRHCDLANSIIGCNVAMPRIIPESIGGYDARIGPGKKIPSAEDIDFIYRAYLAGFAIEYVPDMAVKHFHGRKTREQGHKLAVAYALGKGAMYVKYVKIDPNFCRQFYWDIKTSVLGMFKGEKGKIPEAGFSYAAQIYYNIIGMFMYAQLLLCEKFRKYVLRQGG